MSGKKQTRVRSTLLTMGIAALAMLTLAPDARALSGEEDIIVTARKREESLQRVPVAVTAMSGTLLAEKGITTPQDLGTRIPSLISRPTTSSGTGANFYLRGQGPGDVLLTIDTAVGVYVDGVYIARPKGLNAGFFDLGRIEVLKGPQGTLYGRNTTGGAINIISKGADYDGIHGFIGGEGGNHADWKANGAINIPIVDDILAVRLAYQHWNRDGFGRSRITGQKIGLDHDDEFFRGSLILDPADGVHIDLKGEWTRLRQSGNLIVARGIAATPDTNGTANTAANVATAPVGPFVAPDCTTAAANLCPGAVGQVAAELFGVAPAGQSAAQRNAALAELLRVIGLGLANPYENEIQNLNRDDLDSFTLGGTVTFDLSDDVQLKSITAIRRYTLFNTFDLDGTRFQILEVGVGGSGSTAPLSQPGVPLVSTWSPNFTIPTPPDQKDKFFSQEFNLSGTGWDDRLTWLGGVYYSNENGRDLQISRPRPAIVTTVPFNDGFEIQNTSWSVYSQNDMRLDEWVEGLSLTFGGRYTEERRVLVSRNASFNSATGFYTACLTTVPATPINSLDSSPCTRTNEATFTGFSWLGSLNWQVNDDLLVYIKNARGFRGGAHQLRAPDQPAAGPETARETEIGVKSQWSDFLTANLAAYTTSYGNKQESIIVSRPDGSLATVVQNAASAKIKGVELELTVTPTEGLQIYGNMSYLHGKYLSFPGALAPYTILKSDGTGFGTFPTTLDATGTKFAAPPWTYAVGGRYEFPIFGGTFGASANWAWTAGARPDPRLVNPNVPASVINSQVALLPTFANGRAPLGLLNVGADYHIEDWGTTITFFMTNALNKVYSFTAQDATSIHISNSITGEPRMWGFQIKKTFGAGE